MMILKPFYGQYMIILMEQVHIRIKLFYILIISDFKQKSSGWIFYTASSRTIPNDPPLLSWKTHSWYNIQNYIRFNQANVVCPIFHDIQNWEPVEPNTLDRSL